ncbi:MAG: methylmalonyl-CoA epimerase [Chloroflexi bacterium]|jgi:methylmalonyl-CoA/ethylmalonyl-CoA epimerase|nr:MAG: methylmalonyl-CoA epimerase [Chloroflexota bacterium]
MFETIDHIGLAVTDIAEAVALYQTQFGVQEWEIIELPERHMRVAITTIGTSMVELIAPTAPEAAFAKYLAEKGPGMHHIAYRVADITAALATLKAQGLRLVDEVPRPGLHGTLVAFVHPKATMGTLIELVQHV